MESINPVDGSLITVASDAENTLNNDALDLSILSDKLEEAILEEDNFDKEDEVDAQQSEDGAVPSEDSVQGEDDSAQSEDEVQHGGADPIQVEPLPSGRYPCGICEKTYKRLKYVKQHIRINHTNQKNYRNICEACGKKFTSLGGLINHNKIVHRTVASKYSCSFCTKTFISKDARDAHTSRHSGLAIYQCRRCNKQFQHNQSLTRHQQSNCAGEPRINATDMYACKYCGKVMKRRDCLLEHVNAKHERKKLHCKHCNKRFPWRQSKYRHEKKCSKK